MLNASDGSKCSAFQTISVSRLRGSDGTAYYQ